MPATKIKILLVGSVVESVSEQTRNINADVLQKKLATLNSSKAGPFDVCFCVGKFEDTFDDEKDGKEAGSTCINKREYPLPVYVFDNDSFNQVSTESLPSSSFSSESTIVPLGGNLFYLKGNPERRNKEIQYFDIRLPGHSADLCVGSCSKHIRWIDDSNKNNTDKKSKQCDILLTSDWPQGMEDVVNVDTEPLSFDIAQFVLSSRPRYHIAPSSKNYHQSPPYSLPGSDHVCRFLALAPVIQGKTNKSTKYVHALGLVPLAANPPPTTAPSTLPCPFIIKGIDTSNGDGSTARSSIPGFVSAAHARDNGSYSRFAPTRNKRERADESVSLDPPDDPTISTLFLYGLHKDVSRRLQSTEDTDNVNHRVFSAFMKYGVQSVRYPPNAETSTYCFLEFPDQKAAMACLLDCQGRIEIDNVQLTLKWASGNKRQRPEQKPAEKHFVTQAEAADSKTLYFHPPRGKENDEHFGKALCTYLEQTLEESLHEGNEEERITAETEPALKVVLRQKDDYGFLEFASHAAATMALAAVTQSTDGGLVQESKSNKPPQPAYLVSATLRWSKGAPAKSKRQEVLEALGLERRYFERDNRTDCWFCLASPTCETHLITGVYKDWYAAMPKGPVHPGHLLLVPVTHTSQGTWNLKDSLKEWHQLLDKLTEHASQAYNCDLFVFERAMTTKGGYHSHVNLVPIPKDVSTQLETTMMAHAEASGFELRSIQSDLGLQAIVNGGGDTSKGGGAQYFYAEIRTKLQSKRFVYQHASSGENNSTSPATVPLQFAREVLAAVLKNPKFAHWKSCVLDKEEEAKLAKDFRESFAKHIS